MSILRTVRTWPARFFQEACQWLTYLADVPVGDRDAGEVFRIPNSRKDSRVRSPRKGDRLTRGNQHVEIGPALGAGSRGAPRPVHPKIADTAIPGGQPGQYRQRVLLSAITGRPGGDIARHGIKVATLNAPHRAWVLRSLG